MLVRPPTSTPRGLTLATLVGALLANTIDARADEPGERPVLFSIAIDDTPLDRCGGQDAVMRSVEERLRRQVFTSYGSSDITIDVTRGADQPGDGTWLAQIIETTREGEELGHRDVPIPIADCPKGIDTLAVVLAIMIGPARTTRAAPRAPPPTEPIPGPPRKAPSPRPEASPLSPRATRPLRKAPRPRSAEPLRWTASPLAGVAVGTGILPGLAWSIEVGVIVRPPVRDLFAIARGAYWPAQPTGTTPAAEVDRRAAALLGCWELVRSGALTATGCAGVGGSRIRTSSASLTRPSQTSLIPEILLEARVGYRFELRGRLFIEPYFAPQVSAVLRRDRFYYRDLAGQELILLEPAAAAFQTSFGIAVHFL